MRKRAEEPANSQPVNDRPAVDEADRRNSVDKELNGLPFKLLREEVACGAESVKGLLSDQFGIALALQSKASEAEYSPLFWGSLLKYHMTSSLASGPQYTRPIGAVTPPLQDIVTDIDKGVTTPSCQCGTAPGADNFDATVATVIVVVFTFIAIIGFFGNTLVILVIIFNPSMKTSTNYLVLNLAIADLLFVIICVPFTAVKYATPVWIFGEAWCSIYNYMAYVCAWASVYTLVFMSLDRCLAIVFAMRLRGHNKTRTTIIAIVIMWVVVLLSNIPALYFFGEHEYYFGNDTIRKTCLPKEQDGPAKRTFHFSYFVFGFMLPVVVIAALYSVLIASLVSQPMSAGSKSSAKKITKRVTVMVIIVVVVFIICWLPLHTILVLSELGMYPFSRGSVLLLVCCNSLAYANSCMNPLLYTISSTTFREAFIDFLCCKSRRKNKSKRFTASFSKRALRAPDTATTNISSRSASNLELPACDGGETSDITLPVSNGVEEVHLKLSVCSGDDTSNQELPLEDDVSSGFLNQG
ncbi:allatostatin-A receptor-like [Watersipora subatra]|uniref:allatostatin-A receptor-like n=1 Tax=Watersipora subatra TaxID=2589382 RepID=UPI00355C0063